MKGSGSICAAPPRAAAPAAEERRHRKAQRTRQAVARAACELVLERGWEAVTVEEISSRAEISRRTFSRYFGGKEDALAEGLRSDLHLINDLLADRPAHESPLTAYHRAVRTWLTDPDRAWHRTRSAREVLRLVESEPAVRAAYLRVRQDAEARTAELMGRRLPADREGERRAALAAAVAGAAFGTAVRAWIRSDARENLAVLVDEAFEGLTSALLADQPEGQPPAGSRVADPRAADAAPDEALAAARPGAGQPGPAQTGTRYPPGRQRTDRQRQPRQGGEEHAPAGQGRPHAERAAEHGRPREHRAAAHRAARTRTADGHGAEGGRHE